jgi:hypothetical protein
LLLEFSFSVYSCRITMTITVQYSGLRLGGSQGRFKVFNKVYGFHVSNFSVLRVRPNASPVCNPDSLQLSLRCIAHSHPLLWLLSARGFPGHGQAISLVSILSVLHDQSNAHQAYHGCDAWPL